MADGKPVLVDFTAKWCLTCKVNKALAIEVPTVRERMKALGLSPFGDYTREDPAIAMELKRWKRAGVPWCWSIPGIRRASRVLPEQLTLAWSWMLWVGRKKVESLLRGRDRNRKTKRSGESR